MTLTSVIKGKIVAPIRVTLYGPEGIGKSTFAAGAPKPIFLGSEDGTGQLDVERFPMPQSFGDVFDAIRNLTNEQHGYQTLVIDTLDWMEPIIWDYICKRDEQTNIESYGYGKGYSAALDEWRKVIKALEQLRAAKPMHVVLLAHAWIKTFKNPAGDDFDRYEMKINVKAGGLLKEWSDAVLFANYETFAKKDDPKAKKAKGISTGARLVYTERRAAYDAKNRYGLPEELPLSWADFETAVATGKPADPVAMRAEIEAKAKQLPAEVQSKVAETLNQAGNNAQSLAVILNRVNARLAETQKE